MTLNAIITANAMMEFKKEVMQYGRERQTK